MLEFNLRSSLISGSAQPLPLDVAEIKEEAVEVIHITLKVNLCLTTAQTCLLRNIFSLSQDPIVAWVVLTKLVKNSQHLQEPASVQPIDVGSVQSVRSVQPPLSCQVRCSLDQFVGHTVTRFLPPCHNATFMPR